MVAAEGDWTEDILRQHAIFHITTLNLVIEREHHFQRICW